MPSRGLFWGYSDSHLLQDLESPNPGGPLGLLTGDFLPAYFHTSRFKENNWCKALTKQFNWPIDKKKAEGWKIHKSTTCFVLKETQNDTCTKKSVCRTGNIPDRFICPSPPKMVANSGLIVGEADFKVNKQEWDRGNPCTGQEMRTMRHIYAEDFFGKEGISSVLLSHCPGLSQDAFLYC